MNILKELRSEDRIIAVVLHDLDAVLQFTDRIVVMEQGRAVAVDTPERTYESRISERIFHIDPRCFHGEDGKSYYYLH